MSPPDDRQDVAATAGATADGRQPGWRLIPALTAVVLGLLSFVVGLWLLAVAKPIGQAGGSGAPSSRTGAPAGWSDVISALQVGTSADGNGPGAQHPGEPRKTDRKRDPQPVPQPWPPETLAFAGKMAGDEWSANGLQMKFCWCPAGTFIMGSPKNEKDRGFNYSVEEQQPVTLTKGFWLAKYEATQAQWERVMGTTLLQQKDIAAAQFGWETDNPSATEWWDLNQLRWRPQRRARSSSELDFGEGPNYPIYYVNHLEATDFCRKLTEQERKAGRLPPGWEYRLPTDAQWEYGCRAGTKTATAFGDRLSSWQANFDGDFPYNGADKGPTVGRRMQSVGVYQPGRMQPVGSYQPNAWGLYDMHGNAWEWCRDWDGAPPGGTDPEIKFGDVNRLMRGGSWRSPGKLCRSANRMGHSRWTTGDYETGFRVALVQLDPQPKPAPAPPLNPNPLPPGILVNSIGMKLAPIPAGRFIMGSPVDEDRRPWMGRDEIDYEAQHPVTIREPFYMGVYLVTQGQYQQIMGNAPGYKPSYFSPEGEGGVSS